MKFDLKYLRPALLSAVMLASLTANVFLYLQVRTLKQNPQVKTEQENSKIVERVRRLMVTPDETPTVATVTDPDKLKNQPFFANAKIGDKVLIFASARKAILYDPDADKIIEVAPLSANDAAPSAPSGNAPDQNSGTSTK